MKNIKEIKDDLQQREVPSLSKSLDTLEERLPKAPANIIKLNRAIAARALTGVEHVSDRLIDSMSEVSSTANAGVRTVAGTAKWVAENTASVAATGARQVTGQMKAQTARTADAVNDEVVNLTDTAIDTVEASERTSDMRHYRSMTKAELYELAQEQDLDGRSSMSKKQLVKALTDIS